MMHVPILRPPLSEPIVVDAAVVRRNRIVGDVVAFILAIALAIAHFVIVHQTWSPAHAGNNQNGYLVTGKLLAHTGSPLLHPANPFEFVGFMWGMTDQNSTASGGGAHFAKYPIGYPLLVAFTELFSRDADHKAAYLINPVAMSLAVLGAYVLGRQIMSPIGALFGAVATAFNVVLLSMANNPNSHATATCAVVWGVAGVVRYAHGGGRLSGVVGAFLLGYAYTIRYSEGLLGLCVGAAVCYRFAFDWRLPRITAEPPLTVPMNPSTRSLPYPTFDYRPPSRRSVRPFVGVLLLLGAWALPVVVLSIFNKLTIGSWNGYSSTSESTAFTWREVQDKWRFAIKELYGTGAYLIFPIALLGLFTMWQTRRAAATILWCWLLPVSVLYMGYYWGKNLGVWGFLRFYCTVLPALAIAAAYVVDRTILSSPRGRWMGVLGALVFSSAVGWMNWEGVRSPLQRDRVVAENFDFAASETKKVVPAGSTVFIDANRLGHHFQFACDFELYGADWLLGTFPLPRIQIDSTTDANPIQPWRRAFMERTVRNMDVPARRKIVGELIDRARAKQHDAFVLLAANRAQQFIDRFVGDYETTQVAAFTEPGSLTTEQLGTLTGLGTTGIGDPAPRSWVVIKIGQRKPEPASRPVDPPLVAPPPDE